MHNRNSIALRENFFRASKRDAEEIDHDDGREKEVRGMREIRRREGIWKRERENFLSHTEEILNECESWRRRQKKMEAVANEVI